MPVPFALSTVGYSVTYPILPYQNADKTEFSKGQKPLCIDSGQASAATCEKCRSANVESLNRQLSDLVKKHGLVEVTGKEILGWYMLLSAEDRRLIKEYGHISVFIQDNPSLSIVNNWVQLKSENTEILESSSEGYSSSMESSQCLEDNRTDDMQYYCDKMLKSSGHAAVSPQSDALWFKGTNDFKKGDLDPMNTSLSTCRAKSLHFEIWDTSRVEEQDLACDTKDIKGTLKPVLSLDQGTAQDLSYVTTCLPGLRKEPSAEKQFVSECDMSFDMKLKTDKNFKEPMSAVSKEFENSAFDNYTSISNFKDDCSGFEGSKGAQDEWKSNLPPLQCFSNVADNPVDYDCSSVGTLDDETFFSAKSGSFYSRSSSPFSLDDSTDVEKYVFEETLEDLASFSFYRQPHNSQIVPVQTPVWDPSSNKNLQGTEKSTIYSKTKLIHTSSNTDLSWLSASFNDKETQTKTRSTQDAAVNTDPIESGLFSQTPAAALKMGIAKDVEESKGGSSPPSPEALLQRAVKAELQLVDVQRWLGWQMCWKTQQQNLEKQSFFNTSNEPSEQSAGVTTFSLSSALAEVEAKYQEMRAKIQSGTPLDALVPLTMQLTTVETSTDNLLKDTCQQSGRQNVSDVPAEGSEGTKCMKNDLEGSLMSHLGKCEQKTNEYLSEKPNHYYVHVGNIAPCVKEGELMDIFGKYHVFNIFLEESSLTSSYAVLIFCKSEEAEAAIGEMDGKMLYGKKLKVRAVKTPNNNLPLAFQNIKSVSGDLTQDGKGRFHPVDPNVSLATEPPKVDAAKPSQVQQDHTHAAPVGGSLQNPFSHMPSNTYYSHVTTTQGVPVAPPCSPPSFSNYMAPGYQWMWQSQQSNISYSSMPNLMYVPFSYPLYKLPNHAPFPSAGAHPSNCIPGINMKSNPNTQFGKDHGKPIRAKPVKYIHSRNKTSSLGASQSIVHNQVTSSTDKTNISERDTGAKLMEDKPACDEQKSVSGSSKLKSATPLRFPTSVPPSVTIPEASKPSVNPDSSEVLTYSAKVAKVSSSVTSEQEDSLAAGKMVWGVYPKLDTSSELPIVIIPNQLNFSQFKRVVKYLTERHKDATTDQIVRTLEEIRRNKGGTFGGLTIPEIIYAVSSKLAESVPPA